MKVASFILTSVIATYWLTANNRYLWGLKRVCLVSELNGYRRVRFVLAAMSQVNTFPRNKIDDWAHLGIAWFDDWELFVQSTWLIEMPRARRTKLRREFYQRYFISQLVELLRFRLTSWWTRLVSATICSITMILIGLFWLPVVPELSFFLLGVLGLFFFASCVLDFPAVYCSWANFLAVGYPAVYCFWSGDLVFHLDYDFDGINLPFLFLVVSLFPLVFFSSVRVARKGSNVFLLLLFLIEALLVYCFAVDNLFLFYAFFEVLAFPMFLLIGMFGPRTQRISAAYKFFVYTFVGSSCALPVVVYLYFLYGTTHSHTSQATQFTEDEQSCLFAGLFVPFAVKIPTMPLHLWLPEAHVEAPTPVSIVLAALLLKTGGYAFVRFVCGALSRGIKTWSAVVEVLGTVSVFFGSVYALVQVDLKKMIAYASVAHMNLVLLGIFSGTSYGCVGATYLMLAHGYTSAGLFAGIGVLYDRYHTRTIRHYGGLVATMPVFCFLFFLLTLGNFSFPFTGGFVGEFMILISLVQKNFFLGLAAGTTVFLSLCYSVWLFNRVFYGVFSVHVKTHQDVTHLELYTVLCCSCLTVILGFFGSYFTDLSVASYLVVYYVS